MNAIQRKSVERQAKLKEARGDYEVDLRELDAEIDTIDDMLRMRHQAFDKQY